MLLQNGNREYYKKITVQQNEIVLEARIIEKLAIVLKYYSIGRLVNIALPILLKLQELYPCRPILNGIQKLKT